MSSTFTATPEQLEQAGLVADHRKAMLLSPYFEILEIIEREVPTPLPGQCVGINPGGAINQIKQLCYGVLEAALARKEPKGNNASRCELIAKLCGLSAPIIGTYPTPDDISEAENYCALIDELASKHRDDVMADLPVKYNFVASRAWAEDVEESREDTRAETRREFRQAAE